jgi:L-seryl-tRNA(Ser) seleniumtransferase
MHDKIKSHSRRSIPAVNKFLEALEQYDLPRPLIVDLVRRELAAERENFRVADFPALLARVRTVLDHLRRSRLQSVINGTGIIVHTNLGRAPLAIDAMKSITEIAAAYTNLEYDLASGERGHRGAYLERALAVLCGAESATVVNNCAAALVLMVRHFTAPTSGGRRAVGAERQDTTARVPPREVIISRGELVQIGGGFRIGDIIESTGARLREVGATNKTTLRDYERALGKETAMILRVHRSNFFMEGFVDSPSTADLAKIARKKRVPLIVDLGTGLLKQLDPASECEPTPAETLKAGADLICFSGDKLFGGPQAGIIAGKKRFVSALKNEPLFRALRADKLCFAALQSTVDLHLNRASRDIPVLAMSQTAKDELRARAANIVTRLRGLPARISVGRGAVKTGGGTLPRAIISSISIDIHPENCSANQFAARMRALTPPVIGYIANRSFKLDLRTILPHQDDLVVDAIRTVCTADG